MVRLGHERPVFLISPAMSPPTNWSTHVASSVGAHHLAREMPNQDSVRVETSQTATVTAVADGHGHSRHFRSGRGSDIATAVALSETSRWLDALPRSASTEELCASARLDLVADLHRGWRAAVAADVAANPFTEEEDALGRNGDPPEVAYGATLLVAALTATHAILVQIGDGDIVAVTRDGRTWSPIPIDPMLIGHRTTSLAQLDAVDSFRAAVIDLRKDPLDLLLIATDGFANAQRVENWQVLVGTDLARLKREMGVAVLAEELPRSVEGCASAAGSGDDTTVALLVSDRPALGAAARAVRSRPARLGAAAVVLVAAAITAVVLGVSGGPTPTPSAVSTLPPATVITTPPTTLPPPTTTTLPAAKVRRLAIRHDSVEAVNPRDGRMVRVAFPAELSAAKPSQAIQLGKFVLVLAGSKVWRVEVGAPARARPATTPLLSSPVPPLDASKGTVTVPGRSGQVLYEVSPATMAVRCLPGRGLTAKVCVGAISH
jgi:hypothetical protein